MRDNSFAFSRAVAALALLFGTCAAIHVEITPAKQLMIDGMLFDIRGVCYSPVPIGESPMWKPHGDYFTPKYKYIWSRDLPLLKAMGANTIRLYGWDNDADHTAFFDAAYEAGLFVLPTFFLGTTEDNPVFEWWQRQAIIDKFVSQVRRYADHPALLMWSFGNELNGAWNGFLGQFSDAFHCGWNLSCQSYTDPTSWCNSAAHCVYFQLFHWINDAATAARAFTSRPIITGLADVDNVMSTPWSNTETDKITQYEWLTPSISAWGVQLYRGRSFGNYFDVFAANSGKPLIITEYGIDAYNDPCGWEENNNQGTCFNLVGDDRGGDKAPPGKYWIGCADPNAECHKEGQQSQADWDAGMTLEIMNHAPIHGGVVIGGFIMAWADEYWKGYQVQDHCNQPCPPDQVWNCLNNPDWRKGFEQGGWAGCSYKAHFTCNNGNAYVHDLCGYSLGSPPDRYVNEEWFGMTAPEHCPEGTIPSPAWPQPPPPPTNLDKLILRPVYYALRALWTGVQPWEHPLKSPECDVMMPCFRCCSYKTEQEILDGACNNECRIYTAAPTTLPPTASPTQPTQPTSEPTLRPTQPTISPTVNKTSIIHIPLNTTDTAHGKHGKHGGKKNSTVIRTHDQPDEDSGKHKKRHPADRDGPSRPGPPTSGHDQDHKAIAPTPAVTATAPAATVPQATGNGRDRTSGNAPSAPAAEPATAPSDAPKRNQTSGIIPGSGAQLATPAPTPAPTSASTDRPTFSPTADVSSSAPSSESEESSFMLWGASNLWLVSSLALLAVVLGCGACCLFCGSDGRARSHSATAMEQSALLPIARHARGQQAPTTASSIPQRGSRSYQSAADDVESL